MEHNTLASILATCGGTESCGVWFYLIVTILKLVLVFAVILAFVVLSVWIERRVAGWIQDRPGPNRAGIPLHLFQRFGKAALQKASALLRRAGGLLDCQTLPLAAS